MSLILSLGFPSSIFTFASGVAIGLGITFITFGVIGIILFFGLVYSGVIRITPILNFINKCIETFFPKNILRTKEIIKESFIIRGKPVKKGIYCFHPHGAFSVSFFFHQMTSLTNAPIKGRPVVAEALYWLPWGSEILDGMRAVPNNYRQMKKVLEEGESLSVIPGGINEMYLDNKIKIQIQLSSRKGIFKLALETGTPLIPVISYGEEKLYKLADIPGINFIRNQCKKIGLGLPIPSFNTIKEWIKSTKYGLSEPILTFVGDPVVGEKGDTIESLREKYILGLKKLYEKTKPYEYKDELEIF